MRFADIHGQERLKERLRATIDGGRVSHAQMFSAAEGSDGSGDALPLALAYIQYLNCASRTETDSCGVCPSCEKISKLAHPDVHFVMPVNKQGKKSNEKIYSDMFLPQWRELFARTGGRFTEQEWYDALGLGNLQGHISVADANEIIRKLSFKSFEGGYKSVVVWLPERMSLEAANTLLKILEEPWDGTLFILVSSDSGLLLPTILSRVQQVVVPPDPLQKAAGTNEGEFELFTELMRLSYNDRHLELFGWAEKAARLGRERQRRLLESFVRLTRASFMIEAGLENIAYLWGAELDFCRKFAPFITVGNIEGLVDEMETASAQLRRNGNATIVFTHFALAVSKMIVKK